MCTKLLIVGCVIVSIPAFLLAQSQPASDPLALSYAAQSIAAMTGGTSISDVTLTGSVSWNAGADSGTATLQALGVAESRMDLVLSSGTRSEIRDAQTGSAIGQWINPGNTSGSYASQNCWTDAVWFFPALGSLAVGPNVVLSYIGQETRNGAAVQHIQSYVYDPNWPASVTPSDQQLSTMDFYLDASSLLPTAILFNTHPDSDATTNIPIEIDFSNYQNTGGVTTPQRIQRYLQGTLAVDITVTGVALNTGLTLSNFAINQ